MTDDPDRGFDGCGWIVLSGIAVWAVIFLVIWALSGCTAASESVTASAEASKAGCLCVATQCRAVVSASGQAALGAEASSAVRTATLEGKK